MSEDKRWETVLAITPTLEEAHTPEDAVQDEAEVATLLMIEVSF